MRKNERSLDQKQSATLSPADSKISNKCLTDDPKDGAILHWPLAGYRRFRSPEELKAIREGNAPRADVIELKRKDPRPPDNG
jgi:hypothetical protein